MTLTRAERDQFTATTPDDIAYGEGACLETPSRLFELLNERFKFNVDLTANEKNHLLPFWFGPGSGIIRTGRPDDMLDDALQAEWYNQTNGNHSGFSNPPYGPFISKILKKAIEERANGFTSVFLLPMRASGWFRDLVLPYYSELWYCSERLVFHYQGQPRLAANEIVRKIHLGDGRLRTMTGQIPPRLYARQELTWDWNDTWGKTWYYTFTEGDVIQVPAGALFDSIIVVYKPWASHRDEYGRGQYGLFPPPQRPNIFEVKTGELRF